MRRILPHAASIMIVYAVALHITWGLCMLADTSAAGGTALGALYRSFGNFTAPICFVAAVMALCAFKCRGRLVGVSLMLPQQFLLVISAVGAAHAMEVAHFADGVERSRAFIISDQAPAVLASIGHTIAVLRYALRD